MKELRPFIGITQTQKFRSVRIKHEAKDLKQGKQDESIEGVMNSYNSICTKRLREFHKIRQDKKLQHGTQQSEPFYQMKLNLERDHGNQIFKTTSSL